MTIDHPLRTFAVASASGILIALSVSGGARAITETIYSYSTPHAGYLMIPPAAFTTGGSVASYAITGADMVGDGVCFIAPVNSLPQGAKMTALAMWYYKGDSTNPTAATGLYREKLSAGPNQPIKIVGIPAQNTSSVYTQGNANIPNTAIQLVDNQHYHYFIQTCLSSTEHFYGARIAYTYTNAGD